MGLFDLIEPIHGKPAPAMVLIFQLAMAGLVMIIMIVLSTMLGSALVKPAAPKGWTTIDYDAAQGARDSLTNYLKNNEISADTTPMSQFSVATANFGGIFTESISFTNPWIGSVSPEAARLQVEAGARALILNIWPDPADRQTPIVTAMIDTQEWSMQNTWIKWGLNRGVGRYSNWQHLTRNKAPVGEILKPALKAAFEASPGPQNTDPFFLILKLHGAMTTDYLNNLGASVQEMIGGHAMGAEWNKCLNQQTICTAPVVQFMSKVFVIVIPDIQPGYNSLPNINTYTGFIRTFLNTRMGEITNAMEQGPNTMCFEPSSISAIPTAGPAACASIMPLVGPGGEQKGALGPGGERQLVGPGGTQNQTGFCIVQPSTGGQTTDNSALFAQNSYTACLQSGAQFVAVNLFSSNTNDGPLTTFFDPKYFGKFSFMKI